MYALKNYLLSMQSHWMINQPLYEAVQQSMPMIARYTGREGLERLETTPAAKMAKELFPGIYRVPLFRRQRQMCIRDRLYSNLCLWLLGIQAVKV